MKNQTKYVDGYVLLVPKDKVKEYKKMAKEGAKFWMNNGALAVKECMLEDGNPMPEHKLLTFAKLAKPKPNETVWFSYIEYKNRRHRDQVNKKVMKEMDEKYKDKSKNMNDMPFDMKRMAFGGFTVEVSN